MTKPEAKLENYLETKAKDNGLLHFKFISGITGVPDRILIGNSMIAFVELKAAAGRLSSRQKFIINSIRKHGGMVFIPYNKQQIDDIIAFMTSHIGEKAEK